MTSRGGKQQPCSLRPCREPWCLGQETTEFDGWRPPERVDLSLTLLSGATRTVRVQETARVRDVKVAFRRQHASDLHGDERTAGLALSGGGAVLQNDDAVADLCAASGDAFQVVVSAPRVVRVPGHTMGPLQFLLSHDGARTVTSS